MPQRRRPPSRPLDQPPTLLPPGSGPLTLPSGPLPLELAVPLAALGLREPEPDDPLPVALAALTGAALPAAQLPPSLLRAARAGYFKRVFHGTPFEFSAFRVPPGDVGVHVGTREQAFNRLADKTRHQPWPGGRVLTLQARIQNPLEVFDDLGGFLPSRRWRLWGLSPVPRYPATVRHLISIIQQKLSRIPRPHTREEVGSITREVLQRFGYDAVAYPNLVETPRRSPAQRSFAVLDPRQLRLAEARFEDLTSPDLMAALALAAGAGALGAQVERAEDEPPARRRRPAR